MGCIASNRKPRLVSATVILAAIAFQLAGCGGNNYELEMTVEGETLHRHLICSRETGRENPPSLQPMPEGELQRIATVYGVQTPDNGARKFEFSGAFPGRTPDDVGGAGSLTMYESDLGRTWAYVERFRGEDELTTTLAEREQSMDAFLDAVTAWVGGELGDTRDFERAREFLVGPLRGDLHNVAAYGCLTQAIKEWGVQNSSALEFEMLVRLGQFGLERDYLKPADLPELSQVSDGLDGPRLLRVIRRILGAKLGPDVAVDDWEFLQSPESVVATINEGLRNYPPYETYAATWRETHPNSDPDEMPKPVDYLGSLVLRAIGVSFSGSDSLSVTLHCPTRPFRTNGEWSAENGVVTWNAGLAPRPPAADSPRSILPVVLFAFWSVPSDAIQTEHFGRVVLRDERLARYVMWYQALPPAAAEAWDQFVAGLEPSTSLRSRVETFRFATDSGADAQNGKELVLSGIDEEP